MAFSVSVLSPIHSSTKFPIKHFGQQPCRTERCLFLGIGHKTLSKHAAKVSMPQFSGPEEMGVPISVVKEKLVKSIPEPVKDFEWNKASALFLTRLLHLGQQTLKWSIIAFLGFSSLSDIVFSISRNQELIIPCGLLVGCLVADLLKEISLEILPSSQGMGLNWKLISIGFVFVLVKSVSACLGLRGKVFLLHVANGGFMQVLWMWKNLTGVRERSHEKESLLEQNTSLDIDSKA